MSPIGIAHESNLKPNNQSDAVVVGQYVSCPYCGHPVPVIQHRSVEVEAVRFSSGPYGEFHERTGCSTCKREFWKCWWTTPDFLRPLKKLLR